MPTEPSSSASQGFTHAFADFIIARRIWVIAFSLLVVFGLASGLPKIGFGSNYRLFFGKDNPELNTFLDFQDTYTKTDNIMFVVQPKGDDKDLFTPRMAEALEALTAKAWTIPHSIRVDSLTNFQHTWSEEDDLSVDDLIRDGGSLTIEQLAEKKAIALAEPLLNSSLISRDATTTGINVTFQFPEKDIMEVPQAATAARTIRDDLLKEYGEELHIAVTGLTMMNANFAEQSMGDMATLVPIMYVILLLVMVITVRSIAGTLGTLLVIMFATLAAMGAAGYASIKLVPISALAPTVILTLAIADSIHVLVLIRKMMARGMDKVTAIKESLRVNLAPVTITSMTTIIGFLALNFSDSPPFHHLGNITAVGIVMAWFLSIGFLPAIMSFLPLKAGKNADPHRPNGFLRYANVVIAKRKPILIIGGVVSLAISAFAPLNELNDEWVNYFDHRVPFRVDAEFAMDNLTGIYTLEYSVKAGGPGGISDPEYLKQLEKFTTWLRSQPEIVHVYSYTDIMRRLNKNLHGDDESFYRLPEEKNLAAQYQLLYELSLPYGLDLNDRISIDKSSTRVTATMPELSTATVREFISRSSEWLKENTPSYMNTRPTGPTAMFAYIAKRNIDSMLKGNLIAIGLIAITLIFTLKSFGLGLLSLIPNTFPILITFGIWALIVGQIGFAAATVAATALGIVVDDTVHFLAKFLYARREKGMSKADSVRYAFDTVGMAMITTTVILAAGFAFLSYSTFLMNSQMGLLTAIAVVTAFIFDITVLPALLLLGKDDTPTNTSD